MNIKLRQVWGIVSSNYNNVNNNLTVIPGFKTKEMGWWGEMVWDALDRFLHYFFSLYFTIAFADLVSPGELNTQEALTNKYCCFLKHHDVPPTKALSPASSWACGQVLLHLVSSIPGFWIPLLENHASQAEKPRTLQGLPVDGCPSALTLDCQLLFLHSFFFLNRVQGQGRGRSQNNSFWEDRCCCVMYNWIKTQRMSSLV